MVYVESPVGVGFSYSSPNDTHVNDNRTMADSYTFITTFLRQYPTFASHDVYISGESYGGHYVPQLAWYSLQQTNSPINLKGILVGNPWTGKNNYHWGLLFFVPPDNPYRFLDNTIDSASVVPFLFSHALISYAAWTDYQIACNQTGKGLLEGSYQWRRDFHDFISPAVEIPLLNPSSKDSCSAATNRAFAQVGAMIDQYDIYSPCVAGNGLDCKEKRPSNTS